ncbi:FAD-dependent oxidoreductase [Pseudactinotalea suaedae]|uniref:FAD-dependent oxidoreductase n=1 Tax=Pseudactinotalea suaedae TaxID=1524924 RepID=UPI0012E2BC83|nr:FAD-dependent oxidoreductase [Pseudactinotalea suaedae]
MEDLTVDVCVVGAGTGGVMAAIAAAESGVRVIVLERDTRVGGVGVRAGIHRYYMGTKGGIQDEVDRAARERARRLGRRARGFHPDALWLSLQERLTRLEVPIVYGAVVAEVLCEGRQVVGVVAETEENAVTVRAAVVVDATGDGDVAALAGCRFTLGRDWDGAQHTFSLVPRVVDDDGLLFYRNFDVGWVDTTDPRDVSRAYRDGRSLWWRDGATPRTEHYIGAASQLGVREGRLIEGEHRLSLEELIEDPPFADTVTRCQSHIDTHAYDYANESDLLQVWLGVFGLRDVRFISRVPYRSLVPRDVDGLLIGCRALSVTRDAGIALRMQRDIHKIGEAAGTAAALCVRAECSPRQLDVTLLQQDLIRRGVLSQADLDAPSRVGIDPPGQADAPDIVTTELIAALGGSGRGRAMWWLHRRGPQVLGPLRIAAASTRAARADDVALVRGLLGDRDAVPALVDMVTRRVGATLEGGQVDRAEPTWVAALIVLRLMRHPAAARDAVTAIVAEQASSDLLHLLRYLGDVADQLPPDVRSAAVVAVSDLVRRPALGEDFIAQGSGTPPVRAPSTSHRWGLELLSAYVLERLGHEQSAVWHSYEHHDRAVARTYATRLRARLKDVAA